MVILESARLNQEIFKNIQITSQENMIIKSLEKFYENQENIDLFISIINSESQISIRLIDHFITKYSKNNKSNYKITENNIEQSFNVYTSYKQQLKAFQKKHFDPFSRGDRIPYFMGDHCIITTIGQLNFFKWFISKKIYNYICDNQIDIEIDMNIKNKFEKKKIKKDIKYKKINKPTTMISSSYCSGYKQVPTNNTLLLGNSGNNSIIVSFNFN